MLFNKSAIVRTLLVAASMKSSVEAASINTQIPPFTNVGGALVQSGLVAQPGPVRSPISDAGMVFGLDSLDGTTQRSNTGTTSAFNSGFWAAYPTATASAFVNNGTLGVGTRVDAANFPATHLQANAAAYFLDGLTVMMNGLPLGADGFFNVTVSVDGDLTCDGPFATCNTGMLFGYGAGTLGNATAVHFLGGEQPARGPFATTQALVPLPFRNGEAFNIAFQLVTTTRVYRDGQGQLVNTFNVSQFLNTMRITGISATDALGNNRSFAVASQSGLNYGSSGISSAVPEPATALTMISALGGLALWRARAARRRHRHPNSISGDPMKS